MPDRQEWLLLALASAGGEVSPVQIQKSMFLMSVEAADFVGADFYEFVPYNYGPFNAEIYHDLERLAAEGFVAIEGPPYRRWRAYSATPRGAQRAGQTRDGLDGRVAEFLDRVVAWVRDRSFSELLRAIYARYPEYKEKSVFVD